MNKKHIALMISACIIACSALSCVAETPEDRIVDVIDTIHTKIGTEKDCDKLAKDLTTYCNDVAPQLSEDVKEMVASWSTDEEDASKKRLKDELGKLEKNENAVCAKDVKVILSTAKCTGQFLLML